MTGPKSVTSPVLWPPAMSRSRSSQNVGRVGDLEAEVVEMAAVEHGGQTSDVLVAGDLEEVEAVAGAEPDDADATEGGVVDLHEGGVEEVDVEAGQSIQVGGDDGDVADATHERHDRTPCIACLRRSCQ